MEPPRTPCCYGTCDVTAHGPVEKPRQFESSPGPDRAGDLQRVTQTSSPLHHGSKIHTESCVRLQNQHVPAWSNGQGASISNFCRYFLNTDPGGDVGSIPTVGILFPAHGRAASVACVSCPMRRDTYCDIGFVAAEHGHGKFAALRATNRTKKNCNSWMSKIVLQYDHGHCDFRAPVVKWL